MGAGGEWCHGEPMIPCIVYYIYIMLTFIYTILLKIVVSSEPHLQTKEQPPTFLIHTSFAIIALLLTLHLI